jgi:hypothetical protein
LLDDELRVSFHEELPNPQRQGDRVDGGDDELVDIVTPLLGR